MCAQHSSTRQSNAQTSELLYLSLYDFFVYWRIELAAYAISIDDLSKEQDGSLHATLTNTGLQKIIDRQNPQKNMWVL